MLLSQLKLTCNLQSHSIFPGPRGSYYHSACPCSMMFHEPYEQELYYRSVHWDWALHDQLLYAFCSDSVVVFYNGLCLYQKEEINGFLLSFQ